MDRFLEKRRSAGSGVDYVSICSPNYLHDAHARLALRVHADAICEKPLVISPWNLDALSKMEAEYQRRVFCVLQLRHLPEVRALKEKFDAYEGPPVEVELTYVTRRGPWYQVSWKGDEEKSGGLAMNIGIHFFDLLLWVFGEVEAHELTRNERGTMTGTLTMKKAYVKWHLSVEAAELPQEAHERGLHAYRSLRVNGEELDLSLGGLDLHTECYRQILEGRGYGIEDARPGVELVHRLRR